MATAETTADEPVAVEEYADLRKLLLGHFVADKIEESGALTITPEILQGVDSGILVTLRHFDILDRKPQIESPESPVPAAPQRATRRQRELVAEARKDDDEG